jgi:hypothetical protein
MPTPSLSELLTPASAEDVLQHLLSIAQGLGLPTTAWQRLGISRTVFATMARQFADMSSIINTITSGSLVSLAARMRDANNEPVTSWLDLRAYDVYGITRIPATYASLDSSGFALTSISGSPTHGPFAPGALRFSNRNTGAVFANTETVTVLPGVTTPLSIVAVEPGSSSTSAPGDITVMLDPLAGVSCSNSIAAVGTDAESNDALLARCIAKLGSLSPNGSALAYYFVATSILDSTQPFYDASLSSAITRVRTIVSPGTVRVYIANASGAPPGGDVTIVDDTIQAWCVPLAVTAIVAAATPLVQPVTYTAYVPAAAGVTSGQVQAAVSAALTRLFAALPIGGITGAAPNTIPVETIRGTIFDALTELVPSYSAQVSATMSVPSADVSVPVTSVPVLGTLTSTVVLT